jgi:hypothetical protein
MKVEGWRGKGLLKIDGMKDMKEMVVSDEMTSDRRRMEGEDILHLTQVSWEKGRKKKQ